nr:unnamed protein product [Callosobruchus analis]
MHVYFKKSASGGKINGVLYMGLSRRPTCTRIEYKNQQSPIGNWLNHLFGLTFLPPAEVGECFAQDFMSDKPQDSKVEQFTDYLVDTYIDSDSKFPPEE